MSANQRRPAAPAKPPSRGPTRGNDPSSSSGDAARVKALAEKIREQTAKNPGKAAKILSSWLKQAAAPGKKKSA